MKPVRRSRASEWLDAGHESVLVSTGFTQDYVHRLVETAFDAGGVLATIFVSHADLEFYSDLDTLIDAFPNIAIVATPIVIDHITQCRAGTEHRWSALGSPRSRLPQPLVADQLYLEGHRFGQCLSIPDRRYLWQGSYAALFSGVLLCDHSQTWTAGSPAPGAWMAWVEVLDQTSALEPEMAVSYGVSAGA